MKNFREIQSKDFNRPFLAALEGNTFSPGEISLVIVYPDLTVERFVSSHWFTSCFSYCFSFKETRSEAKRDIKNTFKFVSYL